MGSHSVKSVSDPPTFIEFSFSFADTFSDKCLDEGCHLLRSFIEVDKDLQLAKFCNIRKPTCCTYSAQPSQSAQMNARQRNAHHIRPQRRDTATLVRYRPTPLFRTLLIALKIVALIRNAPTEET